MTQGETVSPTHLATFDVGSSAHDIEAFIGQIATILVADVPVAVDLSQHDEFGSRIRLEVHQLREESTRD
jgi:hypothetical protein